MSKKKEGTPKHLDSSRSMEDMQDWLKTLSRDQLETYVMDMTWKNTTFDDTDLFRAFIARTRYDIDLVPYPVSEGHRQ